MIDTGRRFYSVALVESVLEGMAAVKMNVMHMSLSELCFRVESKLFPGTGAEAEAETEPEMGVEVQGCSRGATAAAAHAVQVLSLYSILIAVSATAGLHTQLNCTGPNPKPGLVNNGYYTQEDIAGLVAFANARGIRLIPEFGECSGYLPIAVVELSTMALATVAVELGEHCAPSSGARDQTNDAR